LLKLALKDRYFDLRNYTLTRLDLKNPTVKSQVEPILVDLAEHDPQPTVKGNALGALTYYGKPEYKSLFAKYLNDSSYTVSGNALEGFMLLDPDAAYETAKKLIKQPARGELMTALAIIMVRNNDEESFDVVNDYFASLPSRMPLKLDLLQPMCEYIAGISSTEKVKAGIDQIVNLRNALPKEYQLTPVIDSLMKQIITRKETAKVASSDKTGLQNQIDYIQSKIAGEKKGF
jgi:aminopeptidase N